MERRRGAERRVEHISDGHRVEERRSWLAPLVVERGERVRERGSLLEEECALVFVEFQLGGVERHHVDRDAAGEEFLRGGDVAVDVVFGLRAVIGRVALVAVAFADGAAHDDDAIEFFECGGVAVDGGADVGERADGDEGDVAGIFFDLVEEEVDGLRMRFLRDVAAFCPGAG